VLAATANVPETVLDGTVARVDGELAEVDTAVGTVRGLHDDDAAVGDAVQVRIGADAVTIYKESQRVDPDSTSARNRLRGEVVGSWRAKRCRRFGLRWARWSSGC